MKNAAVTVATARMEADERAKAFVSIVTAFKPLAAVAIVCLV